MAYLSTYTSPNHAHANKIRRTYVRDVRQLSNPALMDLFFLVLKLKTTLRANKKTSRNKINGDNSYPLVQ